MLSSTPEQRLAGLYSFLLVFFLSPHSLLADLVSLRQLHAFSFILRCFRSTHSSHNSSCNHPVLPSSSYLCLGLHENASRQKITLMICSIVWRDPQLNCAWRTILSFLLECSSLRSLSLHFWRWPRPAMAMIALARWRTSAWRMSLPFIYENDGDKRSRYKIPTGTW